MDCYLHIGISKTGTSAIQSMLAGNRKKLLQKGYLYPRSPGNDRHIELCWYAHEDEWILSSPAWIRSKWEDPAAFRIDFERRLEDELNRQKADHVVFSDENLFGLPDTRKAFLRDFLKQYFKNIKITVYLRRQDDRLISMYQQQVKTGCRLTLSEFAHRRLKRKRTRTNKLAASGMSVMNVGYHAMLSSWADVFGRDNIIPRIYEKSAWHQGSLTRDFLCAIGLENAPDIPEPRYNNPSLDTERVEFLRLFNHTLPEAPDVLTDDMRVRLRRALMRASGASMLSLPEEELDSFMKQFEDSNSQVARDFFGREDGLLFREPRKQHTAAVSPDLDVTACMQMFHVVLLSFTQDLQEKEKRIKHLERPQKKTKKNKKVAWPQKMLRSVRRRFRPPR